MNPIDSVITRMLEDQERRHAWLYAAGEQIRRDNERVSALPNKREELKNG